MSGEWKFLRKLRFIPLPVKKDMVLGNTSPHRTMVKKLGGRLTIFCKALNEHIIARGTVGRVFEKVAQLRRPWNSLSFANHPPNFMAKTLFSRPACFTQNQGCSRERCRFPNDPNHSNRLSRELRELACHFILAPV